MLPYKYSTIEFAFAVLALAVFTIVYLLLERKRIRVVTEKDLFRTWYDWWHALIGVVCGWLLLDALFDGGLLLAFASFIMRLVYTWYQVAEKESHEQTMRDMFVFEVGDSFGFALCALWLFR